jgi:hypothetical protein
VKTFVLLFAIALIAVGLSIAAIEDWLSPIGPADFRVQWFAYQQLGKKFGSPAQSQGVEILSFTKNDAGSGGIYKIRYYFDKHRGSIYCIYTPGHRGFSLEKIDETSDGK